MCRSIRRSIRSGHRGYALMFIAAVTLQPSLASATERPKKDKAASLPVQEQPQSPMIAKGSAVAPYSVRLRITAFLARQHARKGDTERALIEYHSMLNVDDPAWPDNEEGDSFRIARDIDVARMMSESGFYDHAIRVLQTTLILARVNKDPQAVAVERQMIATAQLAQAKGFPVPPLELSLAEVQDAPAQQRGIETAHADPDGAHPALIPASSQPLPIAKDAESQEARAATSSLPELPPSTIQNTPAKDKAAANSQSDRKSGEKSRLSKIFSSRWRRPNDAATGAESPATEAQARPMISPDVSPTYCPECAGLHSKAHSQAGEVAYTAPRQTQTPVAAQAEPAKESSSRKTAPSTTKEQSSPKQPGLLSRMLGKKQFGDSHEPSALASKSARKTTGPLVAPVVTESEVTTAESAIHSEPEPELALTQHETKSTPPHSDEEFSEGEMKEDGPAPPQPAAAETGISDDPPQAPASDHPAAEPPLGDARRQVGVAGQVPNPGIFAFDGNSTTLAALLRRSGESIDSEKRTRVLRSVDLRRVTDSADPSKDFYCQHIEVVRPTKAELDTPIYGQEVVIVDGAGQQPIYVAVMPHFILQLPVSARHPVIADQIVDQLGIHWPNIREQEIGVVRFEQWGRATKVARLPEADESVEAPLHGGDVLYVDGLSLDRSQVLAAAETIARLAGAKIRAAGSPVQQTSGTEK